jgi:Flp pilus assembly protein TadG
LEAAVVTPLFLLLLFGVIEGGYSLHEKLSVTNMSLVGARSASGNGADVQSDYQIMRSINRGSGGVATSQVTSIAVYKAASPTAVVPTACKTASVAGVCNHYTGTDLGKAATEFGCVGPPGPVTKIDSAWCPTGRKTALSGAGGPPDYIGVYVKATHRNLTGVLGTGLTFTADTVLRIEPRTLT